jgi:hypothetical protein
MCCSTFIPDSRRQHASTGADPCPLSPDLALQRPSNVCRRSRRLRAPVLAAPPITCCRSVPCTTLAALERPATCSATILAVPDGLWPSYPRGNGPACCNDPDFDNGPGLITPQVGKSMHLDLKKTNRHTKCDDYSVTKLFRCLDLKPDDGS